MARIPVINIDQVAMDGILKGKRTALLCIIFVFFDQEERIKTRDVKEGGRMHINSSTIGMDSARRYTSVSGRATKLMIGSGRQGIKEGTGSLFGNLTNTDVDGNEKQPEDKKTPMDALKSTYEEMRSKMNAAASSSISRTDTAGIHEQLMELRQQCLNYLMDILFPERRRGSAWESMGGGSSSSGLSTSATTYTVSNQYYHEETENTGFSTQGTVKCADGREISFNLNLEMSRSFQEYYEQNTSYTQTPMCDPLVINLSGNIADISDQTFFFDIDGDGKEDEINRLGSGSGFLALDKNEDGIINNGSELFGTKSGNGFADLAAYDTDHNGFIDEGDEIWDKLKIWVTDENGNQQLYSLAEKGVGAICLQNAPTDFSVTDKSDQAKGMIRKTGVFLYENGEVGTVQHVDMALHGQDAQEKKVQEGMVGQMKISQEKIRLGQSRYMKWLYDMAM